MNKQPIVKKQWVRGRFICYELLAHANLTSPSHCHSFYPFYRATFLLFISLLLFYFSFPLFLFYFSFVSLPLSYLFSFYFLFIPSLFFTSFSSFLSSFNILVALLEGARKGIINNYHHFYLYN
jgi:hypothetical protein